MKSIILFLAIAGLLDLASAQGEIEGFELLGPVPSLGRSTTKFYYISTDYQVWSVAFKKCVDQGGQLATPSNPVLDDALRQYLVTGMSTGELAWVGGKAVGTTWRWQTTDMAFTYSLFAASNCNVSNSCLHVGFNTGTLAWFWCGLNCTTARKYVCEF